MNNIELFKKYTGKNYPEVITDTEYGITNIYIPYNICEKNGMYEWEYIVTRQKYYNYKGIINVVLGLKYDLSDTLAIILNYMEDSKNPEYKKEFDELQKWRKHAKEFSKKHFNLV